MRCIKLTDSLGSQRGVSLIEALVASALLGIGVVTGLTAWDTATLSAQKAVRQTWTHCIVRSQLDAILAAPWSESGDYPHPDLVTVTVTPPSGRPTSGAGAEQRVTVQARDPQTSQLIQASVLKVRSLQGNKTMDGTVTSDVLVGCPAP